MEKIHLNTEMSIHEIMNAMQEAKENNCELDTTGLWFDWFCKESSLENKGKALLSRLSAIVKACEWNADGSNYYKKFSRFDTYVFFKNNCPCNGRLYDDFRICDLKTGNVLYTIVPKSGYYADDGCAQLWGKDNSFANPLVNGTWQDVKNYFKNKVN